MNKPLSPSIILTEEGSYLDGEYFATPFRHHSTKWLWLVVLVRGRTITYRRVVASRPREAALTAIAAALETLKLAHSKRKPYPKRRITPKHRTAGKDEAQPEKRTKRPCDGQAKRARAKGSSELGEKRVKRERGKRKEGKERERSPLARA